MKPGRRRVRSAGDKGGRSLALGLAGDGQEKLEFRGKLVLGVESVGEVNTTDAAVSVDLHTQRLDVIRTVRSASEIRQVKLNLIPTFIEPHGHGADEGLDSGGALVVGGSEPSAHTLVVQHLDLEREVLLQLKAQRAGVRFEY